MPDKRDPSPLTGPTSLAELRARLNSDEASYLADLQAHGVPTGPPFTPIPAGYNICGRALNCGFALCG